MNHDLSQFLVSPFNALVERPLNERSTTANFSLNDNPLNAKNMKQNQSKPVTLFDNFIKTASVCAGWLGRKKALYERHITCCWAGGRSNDIARCSLAGLLRKSAFLWFYCYCVVGVCWLTGVSIVFDSKPWAQGGRRECRLTVVAAAINPANNIFATHFPSRFTFPKRSFSRFKAARACRCRPPPRRSHPSTRWIYVATLLKRST